MSFIAIHGDRLLTRLIDPSAFCSQFVGGPSSKTIIPVSAGANVQPAFLQHFQQPSLSSLAVLSGSEKWKIERIIALVMFAIIPSSFVFNSILMNYLLAVSLAIHAHWGMDVVLNDYCPKKALPVANIIRYFLSTSAFAGLCYFNYNDMGVIKALKALWALY